MNSEIKLGYWDIRGRGQVPRLLLAYTNAIWEDIKYTAPQQWFGADRQSLGFAFPNLPYVIQGPVKITETEAVIRYIIQRSQHKELLGKTLADRAIVNNIIGVLLDLQQILVNQIIYNKNYEAKLLPNWEIISKKLTYLKKFRGEKQWLLPYLTVVDFKLVELSFYVQKAYPKGFVQFSFLAELREKFNNLNAIKQYYQQAQSVKGPFTTASYSAFNF